MKTDTVTAKISAATMAFLLIAVLRDCRKQTHTHMRENTHTHTPGVFIAEYPLRMTSFGISVDMVTEVTSRC
jgi:hypothetical protein